MHRRATLLIAIALGALLGCGRTGLFGTAAADFDVRSGGPDAANDQGTQNDPDTRGLDETDGAGDDPTVRDADGEDNTGGDLDPADLDRDDDGGDGDLHGVDDIDAETDTAGLDTDADTTVSRNPCGGWGTLRWNGGLASPGRPCGGCGAGVLECATADSLQCVGDTDGNVCGGCTELTVTPGEICGTCGTWVCDGVDTVRCTEDADVPECSVTLGRQFKLLPSDAFGGDGAATDDFSRSLAVYRGTLLVGTDKDEENGDNTGAVFTFALRDGAWTHTESLRSPDPVLREHFGGALATAGDWLVVGAPEHQLASSAAFGAVYVYARNSADTEWDLSQVIRSPSRSADGRFGGALAMSNQHLAVAAVPTEDAIGEVFLYRRTATGWVLGETLAVDTPAFGASVALGDDTVFVGAPGSDPDRSLFAWAIGADRASAVVVEPPVGAVGAAGVGSALAYSGGRLLVGAASDDEGEANSGAAYVYTRSAEGWRQTQRIRPSVVADGALFGAAVALSSELAAIGAYREPRNSNRSGAIYIFQVGAGGTSLREVAVVAPDAPGARLGRTVALDGGRVFGGAISDPTAGEDAGAVYVYSPTSSGTWSTSPALLSPRAVNDDAFGTSVSLSSSIIAIGAPLADGQGRDNGAVHIHRRTAFGWSFEHRLLAAAEEADARFGAAVDLDGATLVVGAPGANRGGGAAHVYTQLRSGEWELSQTLDPPPGARAFGAIVSVSSGWMAVGAAANEGAANSPGVWLLTRRGRRWEQHSWLSSPDSTPGGHFAAQLREATLIIGAPGFVRLGRVDIFQRGSLGSWALIGQELGPSAGSSFGGSVDIDVLDGRASVVAGAPGADRVESWETTGSGSCCYFNVASSPSGVDFGQAVGTYRGVLAVGAPKGGTADQAGWGHVVAYDDDGDTWTRVAILTDDRGSIEAGLGESIAVAERRIAAGAPRDDEGGVDAGAVLVFE